MLIQHDLAAYRTQPARGRRARASRSTRRSSSRSARAWGLTIRDGYGQTETTAQVGNRPGSRSSPARWAGRCRAIAWCCSTPTGSEADEGEIALDLSTADRWA